MDIAEFLAARLDEDERMASAACARHSGTWAAADGEVFSHVGLDSLTRCDEHPAGQPNYCDDVRVVVVDDDMGGDETEDAAIGEHVARHSPVRVLADVAAKRAILRAHTGAHNCPALQQPEPGFVNSVEIGHRWHCSTLSLLVYPYADHADCDPMWTISSSGISAARSR